MTSLLARPATARAETLAHPGGSDRLVAVLEDFRTLLGAGEPVEWTPAHSGLLEALLGHDPAVLPARSRLLSDVVLGDCSQLRSAETADLDPAGKRRWAADRLARLITAAIQQLQDDQATQPPPAPRIDPTAANRALFDASPEATRARRYEATTERALFQTLKEIRQLQTQRATAAQVAALDLSNLSPKLGSFCPAPAAVPPQPPVAPPAPVFANSGPDQGRPQAPRRPDPVTIGSPPAD